MTGMKTIATISNFNSHMRNLMSRNLLTAGLVVAVSMTSAYSSLAATTGLKTLPNNVLTVVAQLTSTGRLPATNQLFLAIGLPLRNTNELETLLQQVYDPTSTNYHHYLTPEEFTTQFGPTPADYKMATDFAEANGFEVVGTHPNRMLVDVRAKVSDVEKAFHFIIRTYRHPSESRDFFAPDAEPTVNEALPFLNVSGLDNYSIPHPGFKKLTAMQPSGLNPNAGSGPGQSFQGNDFRKAYVPGTTLTGAGQNVGLLQFDGFFASDISAYATQIGLTTNIPNLVVIPVDGGVPSPNPNSGGVGEVSLDIEMVLSMSPGVSNIYVYEAPNPSPWVDLLNRMATDNLAKQLSSSWGGGSPNAVAEQIFQQMAIQGQTFFNASGDSDAYTGTIPFPSDSPHITVVGGTFLTTDSGAAYSSETVWNRDVQIGSQYDGAGSSGGISTFYSIPSWQTNVNFTASHGSTTLRNIPDVAMTAENVWIIFGGGQVEATGGTSCASPLWAAFTALVNQQAAINGHSPVGFINPAIYTIASGPNYNNSFHDITTGNNKWSASPNLFSAVTGYDLCTGLGTPNGTNLINALVSPSLTNTVIRPTPPPPPYGTTLSSLIGSNPNGSWTLYIQDDTAPEGGVISNGWSLNLTSANPVGFAADLAVTKTASASTVVAGSNLVYSITVTNYGPSTSSNVLVSDDLPAGLSLVSTNTTVGSVLRSGSTVIWNAGTLATNAGGQLTLVVKTSIAGTVVNSAISSSDTPDPNPDDNVASATVNVVASSPPQLSGSYVGGNHQFQFLITDPSLQAYVVQASTNLVNWVPIYTNPAPSLTTTTNIDTSSTNFPYRFYRVLLQ